ncbi:MAG TPA: hypothetical protein VJ894_00770, partial [Cryomorphaceae bacterium]|nr:hypothetical protein [Cryomorphaceae bacterium]
YGRSGTGKTSIIRCGLGNAFNDQDWLPVFIRRKSNINLDIVNAIRKASVSKQEGDKPLKAEVRNLYLDHFKPVYLLFDQFEELFIFGGQQEITTFFESIKSLTQSEENVHLIFVIREEYLANLTEAEEAIPDFLENRIRIEHLTAKKLRDVVEKMCEAAGIAMESGFSEELIERMTSGKAPLELSYLQVYLDAIRKKYPKANRFTKEMIEALGGFGDVLRNFLQRQLDKQPEPAKGETVLKAFVSAQGTKRLVSTDELKQLTAEFGILMEVDELDGYVNRFVTGRILRQLGEEGKFELRHDTLAKVIYERITLAEKELLEAKQFVHNAYNRFQKNSTQLRDEDLDYLAPYAKRLYLKDEQKHFLNDAFERKERRRKRTLRLTQIGVGVLLLLLIFAGFLIYENYQEGQLQARIDESHRLAELSKSDEVGDPMLAFLLAEKAHQIYEGPHTHNALLEAYDRGPGVIHHLPTNHFVHISDTSFIILDQINNKQYCINHAKSNFIVTNDNKLPANVPSFYGASDVGFWYLKDGLGQVMFSTWEGRTLQTEMEGLSGSFLRLQHPSYSNMASIDGKIFLVRKDSLGFSSFKSTSNVSTLLKQIGDSVICKTDLGLEVFSLSSHSFIPFSTIYADSTFKKSHLRFEDSLLLAPFDHGFHVIDLNGKIITLQERHFSDGSFEYLKQSSSNAILFKDEPHLIIQFTEPILNDMPNAENKTYFFDISRKEPQLIADSKEKFVSKFGKICFAMYDDVLKTFSAPLPLNEYDKDQPLARYWKTPSSCMDSEFSITDVEYVGEASKGFFFFKKAPPQLFTKSLNQLLLISEEGKIIWTYNLPHGITSSGDLIHTTGYADTEAVVLKKRNANEIIVFDKAGAVIMKKTWPKKTLQNQRVKQEILLSLGTKGFLFNEVGATHFFPFPNGSPRSSMGSPQFSFQEGPKTEINLSGKLICVEQKNGEVMLFQLSDQGKVVQLLDEPFEAIGKMDRWVEDSMIYFSEFDRTRPMGKRRDIRLYEISSANEISLKAELLSLPGRTHFLDNSPILAYAFSAEDLLAQVLKRLRGLPGNKTKAEPKIEVGQLLLIDKKFEINAIPIQTDGNSTLNLGFNHIDSCLFVCKKDTLLVIDLYKGILTATALPGLSLKHSIWCFNDTTALFKFNEGYNNAWMEIVQNNANKKDTLYGNYSQVYHGNPLIFKKNQGMTYSYSSPSFRLSNPNGIIDANVDLIDLSPSGDYLGKRKLNMPQGFQLKIFLFEDIVLLNSADKLAIALVGENECTTILEMDKLYANGPVRAIHNKFILTNHRLLNQYELFPINGDVAIEMVREQGRLGKVRAFTEEEIEKYQLN